MAQKAQQGYVLDASNLQTFCVVTLEKVGMPAEDARITAEVLVRPPEDSPARLDR